MFEVSTSGDHADTQCEIIVSQATEVFHYKKVDVHFAIDSDSKGYLVYAIKDHDLIIAMLKNNDISFARLPPEILNDTYCELDLPSVTVEALTKALSDFESRTRIEEKEINGQKFLCRLTQVYKDLAGNGEIKSVGRVLTPKEVDLLKSFLFITHAGNASQLPLNG